MANSVTKLIDSNKRLVVRLHGDAAETAPALKIDAGSLNFSLNANNRLLGSGTDRKSNYRLELKKVMYNVVSDVNGAYVKLSYNGDTPNTLISLGGSGSMEFLGGTSDSFTVNNSVTANSTGNLFLQTVGFSGNTAYTIFLDFRKRPEDYDQGQTVAPTDFNFR